MQNPFSSGPSPQQLLILESSIFMLSEKCSAMCLTKEELIASSKMQSSERLRFDSNFSDCIKHCTVSYIQTRQYLRDKLLLDIDNTAKQNDALYRSYYK